MGILPAQDGGVNAFFHGGLTEAQLLESYVSPNIVPSTNNAGTQPWLTMRGSAHIADSKRLKEEKVNTTAAVAGAGNQQIDIELPDTCPVCLNAIVPADVGARYIKEGRLECVYRCPNKNCGRFFITRYHVAFKPASGIVRYEMDDSVPLTVRKTKFDKIIAAISPDFATIYNQAEAAEMYGLTLACGPAYRKSLEFLIKDYVIQKHPDQADRIKRMQLAKCISEFVDNDRIKVVAERAVWLGNDETHYERRWDGKDLKDLKDLISLSVHWIEMEELTAAVLKDMPETGKETAAKAAEAGKN